MATPLSLLCTGFTPDVKLWEVQFSREGAFRQVTKVLDLGAHKAAVQCVSFSGDSEKVATLSKDGTWILWSIGGMHVRMYVYIHLLYIHVIVCIMYVLFYVHTCMYEHIFPVYI